MGIHGLCVIYSIKLWQNETSTGLPLNLSKSIGDDPRMILPQFQWFQQNGKGSSTVFGKMR